MSKLNVETIENLSATTSLNVSDIASRGEFSADTGATLVGFKANGVGAVATTVQAKLRESVSVKDFGTVGDGVADDTAAIQDAASYASGMGVPLDLLGLTFNCSSILTFNCNVIGHGATILGQVIVTSSDVWLSQFNIVSPAAIYGLYLHGTSVTHISNVHVESVNVTFSGGTAALRLGILGDNADNIVIDNCKIDYGVNLIRCANYRFSNNTIDGKYENENELLHSSVRSHGVISSNTFLNSHDNWIDLYSSGERTVVDGNRFIGCHARLGTGIEIKVTLSDDQNNTSGGVNDYGYTEHIIFSNNYIGGYAPIISTQSALLNIYYIDNRSAPSFSWGDVPRNIIVSDNIFDGTDSTLAGGAVINAIALTKVEGIVVSGNIFRDISFLGTTNESSSCVWIEDCRNITVANNIMSIKSGTGVSLHAVCDTISITGNTITDDPGTGSIPSYGIHATKIGSRPVFALTNFTVSGNTVKASIAGLRGLATNGSISDFTINGNNFDNEVVLEAAQRGSINGNIFAVKSTRFKALGLGNASSVSTMHITIVGNTVKSPSGSPKPGIEILRARGLIVSNNICHAATVGIFVIGTNASGELDYLTIKDNFSVGQTSTNFPAYSSMSAGDTATLQVANNQKIT